MGVRISVIEAISLRFDDDTNAHIATQKQSFEIPIEIRSAANNLYAEWNRRDAEGGFVTHRRITHNWINTRRVPVIA